MSPGPVEGRHRDGEMVRAHARHRVLLARRLAQALADLAQQVVARLAAEGLVHHAKALHVDEDRRGEALLAPRGVQGLAHPIGEQAAVGKIGERVVIGEIIHARLLREVAQRERNVARELVQQAHLLFIEEVALRRIQDDDAGHLAADEQRQRHERAAQRIVPDQRARAELEALEVALGAALARHRDLAHRLARALGKADRGQPEAALFHRDAAGLVEQRLAVARAHDERVDRAQHLERAVEALDAPLLQLERAGLLQELIDHHAQVLLVEVGARLGRDLVARGERGLHLAQDFVVVRRLDEHARHAVRLRQGLRVLAAEVGGIEHHRRLGGARVGAQVAGELVAIHHRHQDVGDHQLRVRFPRPRQRFPAVGGADDVMPSELEERRQRLAIRAVIVRDEDGGHVEWTMLA